MEQHKSKLQLEQKAFDAGHSLEAAALREKIRALREDRGKSRSVTSSSSASVTIFPPSPSPPSVGEGTETATGQLAETDSNEGDVIEKDSDDAYESAEER